VLPKPGHGNAAVEFDSDWSRWSAAAWRSGCFPIFAALGGLFAGVALGRLGRLPWGGMLLGVLVVGLTAAATWRRTPAEPRQEAERQLTRDG
jgi:hypothetical protein